MTTCRTGNLTRLIHTLAICVAIHKTGAVLSSRIFPTIVEHIPRNVERNFRLFFSRKVMFHFFSFHDFCQQQTHIPARRACTRHPAKHESKGLTWGLDTAKHRLHCYVVVVVVDSHIQRIVLATEETTVTQQVSHRPIKCQSRLWSQRGTKVNGSHHGDNPLLRPTGIQIATKSYAALQAMAPTNIKTVHQTSLLHIESNLDRLGMLSPTHDQRSQQKTGKITLQPVLISKSKFLKATHFVQK